jgi:thiol-disulfide isomerase/thioredoxin
MPTRRLSRSLALVLALAASPLLLRAATPDPGPSAAAILHRAEAQARAQHKNVLLEFGASWCINCKLYDRMLDDPTLRPILHRYFVFTTMDTGEMPTDKNHADTPGGVAYENSIGGKGAGWPFLVVLSPHGKPMVNSFRPDPKSKAGKANIGYPALPVEIDWFMTMLHRGAPAMSAADRAKVRGWLEAEAKTLTHG